MPDLDVADHDLNHLFPQFRALVVKMLECANQGAFDPDTKKPKFVPGFVKFGVFEGYRSVARQEHLYAQGRSRPGDIITNSRVPDHHGYGLAADIVWYDAKGVPHWNGPDALWSWLGHCARANGLAWGGDWKTFKGDKGHIQPKPQLAVALRPKAKAYLLSIGLTTP